MQDIDKVLSSMPILLQLALLAVVIYGVNESSERMLVLRRQGFLKTGPSVALIVGWAIAGFALGGPVLSVIAAVSTAVLITLYGGVKRTMKARAAVRQWQSAHRADTQDR